METKEKSINYLEEMQSSNNALLNTNIEVINKAISLFAYTLASCNLDEEHEASVVNSMKDLSLLTIDFDSLKINE